MVVMKNSKLMRQFTKAASAPHQRGVSMLELMIVLAIAAILMSVAMPSFQGAMLDAKRGSVTRGLLGSLQLARSEAIKRSSRVSVCARATDNACCVGCTDWSDGWLVFTDSGANVGIVDADEEVLQVHQEIAEKSDIFTLAKTSTGAGSGIARPFIRFSPRGESNWRGGGMFLYCDLREEDEASALNVTLSGDIKHLRRDGTGTLNDSFGNPVDC